MQVVSDSRSVTVWRIRRELDSPPRLFEEELPNVESLRSWLTQLCSEGNSNFFLTNTETHDELAVLMDRPFASISFMRSDATAFSASMNPVYPDHEQETPQNCHEFDLGGTPTPVSLDRCLTFDLMIRIVEHIFAHGSRPDWIAWRQP